MLNYFKKEDKIGKKLPNKLWKLLDVAIKDTRKCEKQPDRYEVDMNTWYERNGRCRVCMAGAVLVQTLKFDDRHFDFYDQSDAVRNKLSAIDHLRQGSIRFAYSRLYGTDIPPGIREYWNMIYYEENKGLFYANLANLKNYLKKHDI